MHPIYRVFSCCLLQEELVFLAYGPSVQAGSIYLVAASGSPNFGDDYIARAWLRHLAREHPDTPVWLDCLDPGLSAQLLAHEHPKVQFTNTLWGLTQLEGPGNLPTMRARVRHHVRELGTPRLDIGLESLRSVRSIHLLGGGYLNDVWERNLGIIAAAAEVHRIADVPLYATGQGLLPNAHLGDEGLVEDLATFEYLEARDHEGALVTGAVDGIDDAFLNLEGSAASMEDPPRAVILLQGDFAAGAAREHVEETAHGFARRHAGADGEGLAFVEFYPPLDSERWPVIGERYPRARFIPFQWLWQHGLPVAAGQRWLTTRFHAHLLAAANGAEGIAVSLSADYYDTKHRSLLDAGTGWTFVGVDDDRSPQPNADPTFPAAARELQRRKTVIARKLYPTSRAPSLWGRLTGRS